MLAKLRQEIERLARHSAILKFVILHEPIGIIRLSQLSGFRQHRVRYSLRILEQQSLIKPSLKGALATVKGKDFIRTLGKKLENLRKDLIDLSNS
jgi:predicted transcriptional regulator